MSETHSIAISSSHEAYLTRLVALAATICETPIGLANYFSKGVQHTVAGVGLCPGPTAEGSTICIHAIKSGELFVVPHTHTDERFRDHPYVTGSPYIRFYAGMPIFDAKKLAVGTLCVLDRVPRQISRVQAANLRQLALLLASAAKMNAA